MQATKDPTNMESGLIGLLAPPLEVEKLTSKSIVVGSQIGGREFVKAMARHLPEKSVALFVPDMPLPEVTEDLHRLQDNEGGNYGASRVIGWREAPAAFRDLSFTAFHTVGDASLHQVVNLRSQFAPRAFPATSTPHGLSHQQMLWSVFAHLVMTPTLPCDSVLCTSNAAREALRKLLDNTREAFRATGCEPPTHPLRFDLLPLGVDVSTYRPRDKADTRYLLALPQNKVILLYFGRIDHVSKGDLGPLILAFRELVAKHGDRVLLLLAGATGNERASDHLNRISEEVGCRDQILWRPAPSLIEGPLYYSAADIFVSPVDTLQESFGISPLEAMSSALPAVVSGWSGYRETVVHGKTGFHVTTTWANCFDRIADLSPVSSWDYDHVRLAQSVAVDVDELVRCLDDLISNAGLRESMGQAARQHILEHYDWKCIAMNALQLWEELAAIARSLPPMHPVKPMLERADYGRFFDHYATRMIEGAEPLEITNSGRRMCRRGQTFIVPALMEQELDGRILLTMLNFVKLLNYACVRPTTQDLCHRISQRHKRGVDQIMSHMLWLIKYGYLRLSVS